MCFKSSSTTRTSQETDQQTTPRYGVSDAFNNFMTGYNNQYSPENFAKTQEAANINPYTTEAAARQSGIFPVLSSTMNNTQQIAKEGLSEADIKRYQNPYTDAVVNPMLEVFNQQNRAALNNLGGKFAQQGAFRNSNRNTAYNNYYQAMQPGQNLQVGQLYNSMYDKAVQAAQANIQARLQGAQTTNQLASGASAAAQTQFNMGDAMRNANLQKSMIPYQLYNQGLAGQQTAGNMYGVESSGNMKGTSTTTNSPSLFDSLLKAGSAVFGAASGFPQMGSSAGTSVAGPGGWQTSVQPAGGGSSSGSSWWPYASGGKVMARGRPPAKAGGGGIGQTSGLNPGGLAQQVAHFAEVFSGIKEKAKARGGAIGKAEGGSLEDPEAAAYAMPMGPPLGAMYAPTETFSLGPPPAAQFGPRREEMAPPIEQFGPRRDEMAPPAPPAPFQPTPTPPQPAPVMRPYPEPTPPRPLSDPRTIKQGVYTPGGVMAEPGSWRAYGADLSSLFGTLSTGKDPMGSMADRRREGIQQIMNHEKDSNEATRLYEDMKQRGIHFGNTDAIAAATAALAAERAPLLNLQTQVGTEAARQGIPTEAYATRVRQATEMGLVPGTPDYLDYVSDGKYSQGKAGKQTEGEKIAQHEAAKSIAQREQAIESGRGKIAQIETAQRLIDDPDVYQGALAGWATSAMKLGLIGNVTNMDRLGKMEQLNAIGNQFAIGLRDTSNGAGMPGAMSDADRKFLMASTFGLENSPQGNRLLAKMALEQEQYKKAMNQEAIRYLNAKGTHAGLSEHMDGWLKTTRAHSEQSRAEADAILKQKTGKGLAEHEAAIEAKQKGEAAGAALQGAGTKTRKFAAGDKFTDPAGMEWEFNGQQWVKGQPTLGGMLVKPTKPTDISGGSTSESGPSP